MNEIKIEKGIPVPETKQSGGKWKDILLKLKVGDSFQIESARTAASIRTCARIQKVKITIQCDGYKYRLWRIEEPPSPNSKP